MFEGDVVVWDSLNSAFTVDPGPVWPEHVVLGSFGRDDHGPGFGVWSVAGGDFDMMSGWSEGGAVLVCALPRVLNGNSMQIHVNSVSPCSLSCNGVVPMVTNQVPVNSIWQLSVVVPAKSVVDLVTVEGVDLGGLPNIVILLTGQSNSLGVGGVHEPYNVEDFPVDGILGWNCMTGSWQQARLDDWSLGLKPPGLQCCGFHFARYLKRRYPKATIGLVVIGEGGQSITRWSKAVGSGDIFDASIGYVDAALKNSYAGSISCILWSQGQADHAMEDSAYRACLRNVIDQYRNAPFCYMKTPFISCELPGKRYYLDIDKQTNAIRDLDRDADSKTISIKAGNLDTADPWHFSTKSHRELGRRFLMAWAWIMRGNKGPRLF